MFIFKTENIDLMTAYYYSNCYHWKIENDLIILKTPIIFYNKILGPFSFEFVLVVFLNYMSLYGNNHNKINTR